MTRCLSTGVAAHCDLRETSYFDLVIAVGADEVSGVVAVTHLTGTLGSSRTVGPDRLARQVEVPPRGEPMPADVDPAWDMCDVCGDLLAYCPEWRRRYPEVVEHQAREPRGW